MYKEPITDMGKKSKKGRLTLECDNGQWSTTQEGTGNPDKVCAFECIVSVQVNTCTYVCVCVRACVLCVCVCVCVLCSVV